MYTTSPALLLQSNVNYKNLLLPGPDLARRLAHNITLLASSTHAIKHMQTLKQPTASQLPRYNTLHSSLIITTLPTSGEPQPCKRADTINTLSYTILSRRTANLVRYTTLGNNITVGSAETTHTIAHIQLHPHSLPIERIRKQDAGPLSFPLSTHTGKNNTKICCNQYIKRLHPTSPKISNHTQTHTHTLTSPNYKLYLKFQSNRNSTIKNIYVPYIYHHLQL